MQGYPTNYQPASPNQNNQASNKEDRSHLLEQGETSSAANPSNFRINLRGGDQALIGLATGGTKAEDALAKFGVSYQILFTISACGIMFGAVIGALGALGTFELASLSVHLFLFLFGLIVSVLCLPGSPRWAVKYRLWMRKYIRVLTRITGLSIWMFYLGCMTACTLWPSSNRVSTEDLLLFIAVVISFTVVGASVVGFLIGVAKSMRLRDTQRYIQQVSKGQYEEVFRKYAIATPALGMRMDEFNRLVSDHTSGRIQYPLSDLNIIYNALEDESKDALSEKEFAEWLHSGLTLL